MQVDTTLSREARLERLFAQAATLDVDALARMSPVLVVVPHPDDESLGCGGLLARLQIAGAELRPVLVTDGTRSHPNSRRFDAAAREGLRDTEWQAALGCLGIDPSDAIRLGYGDGDVPSPGDPRFPAAVLRFERLLGCIDPGLIVMPWRRDPHPDHRASNALVRAALRDRRDGPDCLEYLVWTAERADDGDVPGLDEVRCARLPIGAVLDRKRRAIAAHRSQLGLVITDDPDGFVISSEMQRRAAQPFEYFFEARGVA